MRREGLSYDRAQRRLLLLASSDVLLVRGLACGVGSAELPRNLLASSPWILGRYDLFRIGNRLRYELAQKSHPPLRNDWTPILHCCFGVPAIRRNYHSRQPFLDLAIHSHRGRHRICTGMAVHEALCIVALIP